MASVIVFPLRRASSAVECCVLAMFVTTGDGFADGDGMLVMMMMDCRFHGFLECRLCAIGK